MSSRQPPPPPRGAPPAPARSRQQAPPAISRQKRAVVDVQFPRNLSLDPDSRLTLRFAQPGNPFVGVLNIRSGRLYFNPLVPIAADHVVFNSIHEPKVAGRPATPISHGGQGSNGLQSHWQLVDRLKEANEAVAHTDFLGLALIQGTGSTPNILKLTSRCLNNRHVRAWSGFDKDTAYSQKDAFKEFHLRRGIQSSDVATAEGEWQGKSGVIYNRAGDAVPHYLDVTQEGHDGSMKKEWGVQIARFLEGQLGSAWKPITIPGGVDADDGIDRGTVSPAALAAR